MSLLLIDVAVFLLVFALVEALVPMAQVVKLILRAIVILLLVAWLLQTIGGVDLPVWHRAVR